MGINWDIVSEEKKSEVGKTGKKQERGREKTRSIEKQEAEAEKIEITTKERK